MYMTWEERFDKIFSGNDTVVGKQSVKLFISTLLEEQRMEILEDVNKLYISPVPEANGSDICDYMIGNNEALDTIKSLINNN